MLDTRMSRIKASATMAVTSKVAELRREGKDIISLSVGEPDHDTPQHIKEASYSAARAGKTKYAPTGGIIELREAVIEKFSKVNGLSYGMDEVMVTCGGKEGIFNCFLASVGEGDEVIVPAPYWVSYVDVVNLCGGRCIEVECSRENGNKITVADLERAITSRTKWLIINSPCNPSGACYSREELGVIADFLLEERNRHVNVLSDEIYEHIVYVSEGHTSIASVREELQGRVLVINGVSKAYSMTGWRVGYAGGSKELIGAMKKIQSQSISGTSTISQWGALAALNGEQGFLGEYLEKYRIRRDYIIGKVNSIDGLSTLVPDGAFYVYPDCSSLIGRKTKEGKVLRSDLDIAQYILTDANVGVVHGEAFGKSPSLRLSYATSEEKLREAMSRIETAIDNLSS